MKVSVGERAGEGAGRRDFLFPRRCRRHGASKLKDNFTLVLFSWQCGHVLDVLHCTSTPLKAGGMRPNSLVRLHALVFVR